MESFNLSNDDMEKLMILSTSLAFKYDELRLLDHFDEIFDVNTNSLCINFKQITGVSDKVAQTMAFSVMMYFLFGLNLNTNSHTINHLDVNYDMDFEFVDKENTTNTTYATNSYDDID